MFAVVIVAFWIRCCGNPDRACCCAEKSRRIEHRLERVRTSARDRMKGSKEPLFPGQ